MYDNPIEKQVKTRDKRVERQVKATEALEIQRQCDDHRSILYNTPESYEDAVSCSEHEQCLSDTNSEINSLMKNHAWELTELLANALSILCKWIYKTKTNPDGSIEKYKARLLICSTSRHRL